MKLCSPESVRTLKKITWQNSSFSYLLSQQQSQFDMSNTCPNCGPRSFLPRPSPFHAHLGKCIAFDTPTPERRVLLDSVHDIEQDMASCRERIAHLTAALADAENQLDSLEEARTAHIELFPPIHTLPVEVLLNIFQLVVKKWYQFSSIKEGPWGLGHVCRLWRQITSVPSTLWSSSSCWPSSTRIFPMLTTVFERSSPLTFTSHNVPGIGPNREFCNIIKSHSLRWYDIAISGTLESFMQLGDVGELPLLVNAWLDLWNVGNLTTDTLTQILDIFRHAPKLRSLTLHNGGLSLEGSIPQSPLFPWHQLTHLKTYIASTFIHDCQILVHCPNLLSYTTASLREPGPSDSLFHSKLESLDIRHVGLLRYLRCMSLTELTFSTYWLEDKNHVVFESYISTLRSFLAQSPVLASVHVDATDSTTLISLVSAFTSVSIQTFKLSGNIAVLIHLDASAMPLLLPNMIHFEYTGDFNGAIHSLITLIRSRWNVEGRDVVRLRSVRLYFGHLYDAVAEEELYNMIDCLQVLRAEGLDVVVFLVKEDTHEQIL